MSYASNGGNYLLDSDLAQIRGGGNEPTTSVDWTQEKATIKPRALGASMLAGGVTGGLAAASVSAGPAWPAGAVGGALLGGIAYSIENMINPSKPEPIEPSVNNSWGEEGYGK